MVMDPGSDSTIRRGIGHARCASACLGVPPRPCRNYQISSRPQRDYWTSTSSAPPRPDLVRRKARPKSGARKRPHPRQRWAVKPRMERQGGSWPEMMVLCWPERRFYGDTHCPWRRTGSGENLETRARQNRQRKGEKTQNKKKEKNPLPRR